MCELNLQLRKLPPKSIFELCQILEIGKGWKDLMAIVLNEDGLLKYNVEHMRMIEDASEKQKRLCSEIFLEEWGTSGRQLPCLTDLLKYLQDIQLFRAADYVAVNLLKENVPERPEYGPAATILPPTECPPPTAPPLSSVTLLDSSLSNSEHLHETVPIASTLNGMVYASNLKHYTYQELSIGTKGFSADLELGRGGFGSVYKCNLNSTTETLAVKILRIEGVAIQGTEEKQFRTEVLTLSNLSHPNLLSLVGYSCDGRHLCLVYPFMVNGSLQDRIECKGGSSPLEWKLRYEIAYGTASGLLYLHTYSAKPLVHRDVKSANILLDINFTPKVGDFGIAKHGSSGQTNSTIAMTTTVLGTSAYMAPEAFRGDVSVKMDVFSFGVVLLELITGLPPFDENREGCDLASHVDEVENIEDLIDNKPSIPNAVLALKLYDIAQKCLLEKKSRPIMESVLKLLKSMSNNI